MPRNSNVPAVPEPDRPSALMQMSDDVRRDLLRAQTSDIDPQTSFPKVLVLGGGAGMFELKDAPGDTFRDFEGVILGHHKRNILWDRPYGTTVENEEENPPACSSQDGVYGIPRRGFHHIGLVPAGAATRPADGIESVACATCPYNQWGTGDMFNPNANPKGKANTNQRSIYILRPDEEVPVELIISPTSLKAFDDYVLRLTSQMIPVQAVSTRFSQEVHNRNGKRWASITFAKVRELNPDEFDGVLRRRQLYARGIDPSLRNAPPTPATVASAAAPPDGEYDGSDTEDRLPDTPDF